MDSFISAIQELAKRKPVASPFNSAEWQRVAPAIRQKAFFSATVDSAKTLTKWREILLDWLSGATEEITLPSGETTTAYKEVSLAKFRERAATYAIQEGLASEEDFKDLRISNVISNARMQLVYNTNIEQAQEFAYWKERVGNADYLNMFPAAKFVRRPGGNPKYFRPIHVAAEGVIKRWDDLDFWLSMNMADDGGFDVPWGPWGFNSYMRQEPVNRRTAERLGLVTKGEVLRPPNTERFGATFADQFLGFHEDEMKDVPEDIKSKALSRLTDRLGPQAVNRSGNPSLKTLRDARRLLREKYGPSSESPVTPSLAGVVRANPEGFTVTYPEGQFATQGYAVAPAKETELRIPVDQLTDEIVDDYVDQFKEVFERDSEAHLGGWRDGDDYVLDISYVVDNPEDAYILADQGGQDGVFHLIPGHQEGGKYHATPELAPEEISNEAKRRRRLRRVQEALQRIIAKAGDIAQALRAQRSSQISGS